EASIEEDAEVGPIETGVDMELGIGDGDAVRDHVKIDLRDVKDDTEEYEADASAGDTVKVGIDPMSTPIVEEEIVEPAREDSSDSSGTRDGIVRSVEDMPVDLDDGVRDCAFLRSSPKHNLTSSCDGSPSCALVKKYMTSEFAEALTPL
ncbi:hypothetical protein Tco_0113629, partial [Tanacetum coccineum]